MSSLLHQLENNEAVLMMYLAGELPAEDRAEVEQQLAVDAGLRHELELLRGAESFMTIAMSAADGVAMPPVTEAARQSAAVRRVSRAMVRFRLEAEHEVAAPEAQPPARTLRLPNWAYPFAAAAMIVITWVAYWGFSSPGSSGPRKTIVQDYPALPPMNYPDETASSSGTPEDPARRGPSSLPLLAVDEGDRDLLAISAGSYDVSSIFQPEHE